MGIDINVGLMDDQAAEMAGKLGFTGTTDRPWGNHLITVFVLSGGDP